MLRLHLGGDDAGPLKVLCLGAHCDDIEIGCAGTILRLLDEHPRMVVHWVVFASTPEREREARASAADVLAAAGAATVTVHDFRDGYLPYQGAMVKDEFEKLKVDVSPDVIFTHYRGDAHQDHRLICELTWNTFRDHLVLEYEIPKYDGDVGRPNVYVPLPEAVCECKIELLDRHFTTQRSRRWFDKETFRGLMRLRGLESNAPELYAEAFHCRKVVL